MSWKGPVLEKDDPYGTKNNNKTWNSVKHVQEAQIIPEKDSIISLILHRYSTFFINIAISFRQIRIWQCIVSKQETGRIRWEPDLYERKYESDDSVEYNKRYIELCWKYLYRNIHDTFFFRDFIF